MPSAVQVQRATVTTVNTTANTTIWSSPAGYTGAIVARVFGHNAANGNKGVYWRMAHRSDNDNDTNQGSLTQAEDSAWNMQIVEGTNQALVQVSGGASETVNWVAYVTLLEP